MAALSLTRESILDGSLHASVRAILGPDVPFQDDATRTAQIEAMLGRAPDPRHVWVFAFGSLIWNPAFHHVERRAARVFGWHRSFCLWVRAGRGSPELPGLMLSLESGGSCAGVAYRIAPDAVHSELDVLWRREMFTGAYRPVWTTARTPQGPVAAIAFAVNRDHDRYAPGLDAAAIAQRLACAAGPLGRGCDYLYDTVAHLRELGLRDERLEALARRVRSLQPGAGD